MSVVATTWKARQLTDNHRRRQVRLAAKSDSQIRRATALLDPKDIDATRDVWNAKMTQIVSQHHRVSEREAAAYLAQYRVAELGSDFGPVIRPGVDVAATQGVLDAVGPQGFKRRIAKGVPDLVAYQAMAREVAAETRKLILAGGRGVIRESGAADGRAIGWRRVTGLDPCTFCAMLASRGPAYTSEAKALAQGNGDPYHPHCGCSVEILYDDWVPTKQEEEFIDWYEAAAEEAEAVDGVRNQETVLWRMRASGGARDSMSRRRKN